MYLEFQRLGNMGKYEDHETDGWNLTAKIKTSCSRRVYHGSSISVLFVMVLTFCCFALNVKWAFAASSSSPSHVSAGVISSEYNNRLDESLQQLHQHNDVRPQEDESFLLNEVDDDVQSVPEIEVDAVVGGRAELPCDVNPLPLRRDDAVHMVFWFRDDFGKPIYSLDVRGRPFVTARHWSSNQWFGSRAHFRLISEPARLVIENVKLTDEGVYRCRVDFRNSPTRNFRFNLTVLVPPEAVAVHDSSGRLLTNSIGPLREGSDLTLSCHVRGGKPPPHVEWRIAPLSGMGEETVSSKEPIIRQSGGVSVKKLKISAVHREIHGANLTCVTFNSNLTDMLSASLKLNLYLRPLSARIVQVDRLVANQRHQIECIATGSRPEAMITWWIANRQLTDVNILKDEDSSMDLSQVGVGRETDELESNVTRSSLSLVPSYDDDGEKITCRAENPWVPRNSGSQVEDSLVLHVVYPPQPVLKLGTPLKETDLKEGDDVYFECQIKSNSPIHKLKWMFNDRQLQHNVTAGVILSNQTLVLQLVTRRNAGNYTCQASNMVGTTVSNVFPLRIQYAPVCKSDKSEVVGVSKGERVSIKCELDSDPEDVSFRWDLASSGQMVQVPPSRFTSMKRSSILYYSPVSNLDYGSLFCRGTNHVGIQMAPCVFQIVAAEKPSQVTNCTVFNETSESVELSCDEGHDGGLPQHFVLEVFDSDSSEMRYNASSNMPSFHLGNLTPIGKGFRVLVYSVNAKGRGEPHRIDELVIRQSEKYAAVTPSDYSWISFTLSVAIGGTAVFLCVGSVVIVKLILFRSRQMKRESSKKHNHDDSMGKTSSADLQAHGIQFDSKDLLSTDDKDPDILVHIGHVGGQDHNVISPAILLSRGATSANGDRPGRYTATLPPNSTSSSSCCLQSNMSSYPTMDHHQLHPSSDSAYHYQGVNAHQQFDRHHQYYGSDLGGSPGSGGNYAQQHQQQQYQIGQSPMNELDNFSSISTLRQPNHHHHQPTHPSTAAAATSDPYYDTKVMKQKLLSVNVPESCV
ncbi:uncharacterized protein LOC110844711 isoform X2 [Folsomia candida]|uniref:uncharacterized protein LOC110844711 isoform X2 n=1 Tax=Folsomia candida TaxID=158441 RepID=UPI001604AA9C|nr:uncharacterized protein LOC110844711 isoform X2 [Folsomia candida]